ncbi:MAG: OmpA family protein [Acidobacteria bacterium]|nr:OmpA family protein [Acidobacteriota bacterium]
MRHQVCRVAVSLAVFLALAALVPGAVSLQQKGAGFGNKDPGLFNLKGTIYFLPDTTEKMPDQIDALKPQGVIYTDRLDIPIREFSEGFPGVTDRFEWFGLIYTGRFQIDKPGAYKWRLFSDDGSRLWIDGKEIIDNDGIHGSDSVEATITLDRGPHDIKVWYFQGPATEVSLQLFVGPPGGAESIFAMGDFAPGLAAAAKKLDAQATPDGIRIRMEAAILFDTAKSELKPEAREAIQAISEIIRSYPTAVVRVLGFTDTVGDDAYNLKLSEARAVAVKTALVAAGPPSAVRFETQGLGKGRPVASNDTEAGRAKNRRVEVFIKP